MEPTVVAIDDGRVRKACAAVVNFTKFHKNPNELEGGLRVNHITGRLQCSSVHSDNFEPLALSLLQG